MATGFTECVRGPGLLVVLFRPLRVAILQHGQRPCRLHGGVSGIVLEPEFEDSAAPAIPAIVPRAIGILVIENPLDPAAADQVRPAGVQHKGGALDVAIVHPEIVTRVLGDAVGKMANQAVHVRLAAIEMAIDGEPQQLMLPGPPVIPCRESTSWPVRPVSTRPAGVQCRRRPTWRRDPGARISSAVICGTGACGSTMRVQTKSMGSCGGVI